MAIILNIETATTNCSVSLANKDKLLDYKELNTDDYSHSKQLHLLIKSLMNENNLKFEDLHAVAVSSGPGSYTGLRIGISATKGLCFALDIPLIAIDTLTLLAHSHQITEGLKVPILDARRMEVYCQVLNASNSIIEPSKALVVDANSFAKHLKNQTVYFIGNAAEKCKTVISHPNAKFINDLYPSAMKMASLSFAKFQQQDFEDLAYFEPSYLKDFMITTSKSSRAFS